MRSKSFGQKAGTGRGETADAALYKNMGGRGTLLLLENFEQHDGVTQEEGIFGGVTSVKMLLLKASNALGSKGIRMPWEDKLSRPKRPDLNLS